MIRLVAIQVALFLLPTVVYALLHAARRRGVSWDEMRVDAPKISLAIGGLLLVIVSLIGLAAFDGSSAKGVYMPDRFENGHIVPGHIE